MQRLSGHNHRIRLRPECDRLDSSHKRQATSRLSSRATHFATLRETLRPTTPFPPTIGAPTDRWSLLSRILDPETRHFQKYSISFFFGQRPTSHWRLNEQRCRARANGRDGPHGNETYFAEGCFLRPSPEECHILRRAVSRECGDRARSRSWAQTRRGRHPTKARSGTRWPETSGFRGKKKRGGRVDLTRITHQD